MSYMKTTFKLILPAIALFLFVYSCSKDESAPVDPTSSELTFTVEDLDGNTFANNQLLEFSSLEYPDASLGFNVRNTSSEPVGIRIEVEEISGTDGSMMELCFGECYFGVSSGTSYPTSPSMPNVYIEPGQTQPSSGDHFFNMDGGDGNTAVEYAFKFYIADENGIQDGNSLRLIYRYSQN